VRWASRAAGSRYPEWRHKNIVALLTSIKTAAAAMFQISKTPEFKDLAGRCWGLESRSIAVICGTPDHIISQHRWRRFVFFFFFFPPPLGAQQCVYCGKTIDAFGVGKPENDVAAAARRAHRWAFRRRLRNRPCGARSSSNGQRAIGQDQRSSRLDGTDLACAGLSGRLLRPRVSAADGSARSRFHGLGTCVGAGTRVVLHPD